MDENQDNQDEKKNIINEDEELLSPKLLDDDLDVDGDLDELPL